MIEKSMDMWLKFFKDARSLDDEALPSTMNNSVIKQALSTMKRFTEDEKARDIYERRLDYARERSCWEEELEELKLQNEAAAIEAREAQMEAERAREEAGQAKEEAHQAKKEAEEAIQEADRARLEARSAGEKAELAEAQANKLKAKLLAMGVDPSRSGD